MNNHMRIVLVMILGLAAAYSYLLVPIHDCSRGSTSCRVNTVYVLRGSREVIRD